MHLRSPALPQGHHATTCQQNLSLDHCTSHPTGLAAPRTVHNSFSRRRGLVIHDTPRHPQTPTRAPQGSPSTPAPQRLLPSSPARGSRGQQTGTTEQAVVAPISCRCRSASLKPLSVMSPPGTPPSWKHLQGPGGPKLGWPHGHRGGGPTWPHAGGREQGAEHQAERRLINIRYSLTNCPPPAGPGGTSGGQP